MKKWNLPHVGSFKRDAEGVERLSEGGQESSQPQRGRLPQPKQSGGHVVSQDWSGMAVTNRVKRLKDMVFMKDLRLRGRDGDGVR